MKFSFFLYEESDPSSHKAGYLKTRKENAAYHAEGFSCDWQGAALKEDCDLNLEEHVLFWGLLSAVAWSCTQPPDPGGRGGEGGRDPATPMRKWGQSCSVA